MKIELTTNDIQTLLKEKEIVVIDFWASWCGPCKRLSPIIEELGNEYNNETTFIGKANVDDHRELATELKIRSIPCIVFFKNGEEVERTVGVKSKPTLEAMINKIS